jgi:aspartate racemase
LVDKAIYNKKIGIKSKSDPVHRDAIEKLKLAIEKLIIEKSDIIILGCTEIPLAIKSKVYNSIPLIDSTEVLALSLLKKSMGITKV